MYNFQGFSRDVPDFLFEMRINNTFDKGKANAERYKTLLVEPLKQLYLDVTPFAQAVCEDVCIKPARCLPSPYTDRRFSPEKPVKDYFYLHYKLLNREENMLVLCFDCGSESYGSGFFFQNMNTAGMGAIRDKALSHEKDFRAALKKAERNGCKLFGNRYKRDHYPELKDDIFRDLLNSRYFWVATEKPLSDTLFGEALVDEIKSDFEAIAPLFRLFTTLE